MGRDWEHAATADAGGRGGRLELNRPRYVTLPIILVLALIGYVYYMTVFGVIEDWLGLRTASGLGNAAIFTALAIMCLTTYAIAVIRVAGHVPASFMPDMEDPEVVVHEIKRKVRVASLDSSFLLLGNTVKSARMQWVAGDVARLYGIYQTLLSNIWY